MDRCSYTQLTLLEIQSSLSFCCCWSFLWYMALSCCALSRPSVTSLSASKCLSRKGPEFRSRRAKSTSAGALLLPADPAEPAAAADPAATREGATAPLAVSVEEEDDEEDDEDDDDDELSFARAAAAAARVEAEDVAVAEVGATIWIAFLVVRSNRAAEIKWGFRILTGSSSQI